MDDLEVTIIPCLSVTKYSKLKNLDGEIDCVECKDHKINVKECIKSNKLKINLKKIEIETQVLSGKKKEISSSEDILFNNYSEIIRKIDLRREEVKQRISKKIDEIAIDLIDQLKKEQNELLIKVAETISEDFSIDDSLEYCLNSNFSISKKEEKTDTLLDKINEYKNKLESVEKKIEDTGKYDLKVKAVKINNLAEMCGKVLIKSEKKCEGQRHAAGPGIAEALAVLDDGNLALNSFDQNSSVIKIIDMESLECIEMFQADELFVYRLVLLNDGNLASSGMDREIKIWNTKNFQCIRTLEHSLYIRSLIVLNNGNLASGSADGTIRIWDINSFEYKEIIAERPEVKHIDLNSGNRILVLNRPKGGFSKRNFLYERIFMTSIHCLIHLTNGYLVSGSFSRLIKIWDIDNLVCIKELDQHKLAINSLVVLKNGNFASGSSDKTIKIWDTTSYECIVTLEHSDIVTCLTVLNDGNLASGSYDKMIKIWNMTSFECIRILEEHTDIVSSLVVLGNGNLISGSDDETIRIWDLKNFECITCFNHTNL